MSNKDKQANENHDLNDMDLIQSLVGVFGQVHSFNEEGQMIVYSKENEKKEKD